MYGKDPNEKNRWVHSLREHLGLAPRESWAPLLLEKALKIVTLTGSYAAAADVLSECGLKVDDSTLHRRTQRAGALAEQATEARVEAAKRETRPEDKRRRVPGRILILSIDGFMNRERGEHWGIDRVLARALENLLRTEWREIKVGLVFEVQDRTHDGTGRPILLKKYGVAVRGEPGPFGWRLYAEALRRGLEEAEQVVVLADGATWIWNLKEEHFPGAAGVLDICHAAQHLQVLGEAVDREKAREWRERIVEMLTDGREIQALEEIRGIAARAPASAPEAAVIRREAAYFERHADRLHYAELSAKGVPKGSGSIESFCCQLQQRLKNLGRIWSLAGLRNLLAVLLAFRNGDVADLLPS